MRGARPSRPAGPPPGPDRSIRRRWGTPPGRRRDRVRRAAGPRASSSTGPVGGWPSTARPSPTAPGRSRWGRWWPSSCRPVGSAASRPGRCGRSPGWCRPGRPSNPPAVTASRTGMPDGRWSGSPRGRRSVSGRDRDGGRAAPPAAAGPSRRTIRRCRTGHRRRETPGVGSHRSSESERSGRDRGPPRPDFLSPIGAGRPVRALASRPGAPRPRRRPRRPPGTPADLRGARREAGPTGGPSWPRLPGRPSLRTRGAPRRDCRGCSGPCR